MSTYVAGNAPYNLGKVLTRPTEMCFSLYMPIRMPYGEATIPRNLLWCKPIVDCTRPLWKSYEYVYLTAKHLYVNSGNMGNRKGWHIDGFGSYDKNYIWFDCHPTEFCLTRFRLSLDCDKSMAEMEEQAQPGDINWYPSNHVYELDNTVVHRVNEHEFEGMRTFVKVSTSRYKYNLKGNAINPLLDYDWEMFSRRQYRNHPFVLSNAEHAAEVIAGNLLF